jgi:membrane protein DedA with SNARE-associated domain
MRMGYGRFLLLDGLGVLVSVPFSIWLGRLFADQIDRLHKSYRQLHLLLAFAVVTLVIVLFVRARSRRASQRASGHTQRTGSGGDNPS